MSEILYRKELERRAGNGTFCWGIGNSLGQGPILARNSVPRGDLDILFTPMKSAAKAIDKSPSELLLWLSYWNEHGILIDLPMHMVVSSRGKSPSGNVKKSHYALFCTSKQEITLMQDNAKFDANLVRNFINQTIVGASQVTAMVKYLGKEVEELDKPYQVAFRAKFYDVGFVKLAEPVRVQGNIAKLYAQLNAAKNVQDWKDTVCLLKSEARLKGIVRPRTHRKQANNPSFELSLRTA